MSIEIASKIMVHEDSRSSGQGALLPSLEKADRLLIPCRYKNSNDRNETDSAHVILNAKINLSTRLFPAL